MKIQAAEFVRSVHAPADLPRDRLPQIAFAGRSNVGKSSMINCLILHKNLAKISAHPGKTRSINFFRINGRFYFVDLPGYGYAKVSKAERQQWKVLIESYLNRNPDLRALVQIIDSRIGLTPLDEEMLAFTRHAGVRSLIVATKVDKLRASEKPRRFKDIAAQLARHEQADFISFSAKTRLGKDAVLRELGALLR